MADANCIATTCGNVGSHIKQPASGRALPRSAQCNGLWHDAFLTAPGCSPPCRTAKWISTRRSLAGVTLLALCRDRVTEPESCLTCNYIHTGHPGLLEVPSVHGNVCGKLHCHMFVAIYTTNQRVDMFCQGLHKAVACLLGSSWLHSGLHLTPQWSTTRQVWRALRFMPSARIGSLNRILRDLQLKSTLGILGCWQYLHCMAMLVANRIATCLWQFTLPTSARTCSVKVCTRQCMLTWLFLVALRFALTANWSTTRQSLAGVLLHALGRDKATSPPDSTSIDRFCLTREKWVSGLAIAADQGGGGSL